MKHLIIGSGPAGIFAAETIRMRDPEASVIMVTEEKQPGHSPVMLTYWMAGNRSQDSLFFRDPSWSEKKGVDVRPNSKVVSIDTSSKIIRLSEGREMEFDRLLIATGASPISLPIQGKESKGVASLRHQRDAEIILKGGRDLREIVIMGGGFIGLKLACHLKEQGLRIMVFEKEPKLAARIFDSKASRLVEKKLQEGGIRVETDVEVVEILNERGWVSGVRMKDGRAFSCQRVIETVGVRPNTEFLIGSGIDLQGGVPVNERMETNVPGIYAAGDVAMTRDSISTEWVSNAIWPAASRQGRVAGWNMAGGHQAYLHNVNLNAIHLFGLHVMAAGHSDDNQNEAGIEVFTREERESYRKIVIREGQLIGFLLVGDVSGAGFLLSLMKRKGPMSYLPSDLLNNRIAMRDVLLPQLGYQHGLLFRSANEMID
ncbi:MAG: FAD-dependent oxidoreductase [Thermodesulfobacteriota bacterium]|nr:FAD-dependent oxidoreductase [Thermodesulfobacteriota bacterium]